LHLRKKCTMAYKRREQHGTSQYIKIRDKTASSTYKQPQSSNAVPRNDTFGTHSYYIGFEVTMTVEVKVLGIAQDGGRPHAGCRKPCCTSVLSPAETQYPVALGITESDGTTHLVEATPNVADQLRFVWKIHQAPSPSTSPSAGRNINIKEDYSRRGVDHLWITHAHLGHSDGLRQFGREVMSAQGIQLHVSSPSMVDLIANTPMWNIMVQDWKNFILNAFHSAPEHMTGDPLIEFQSQSSQNNCAFQSASGELTIEAIRVPHRGELSDMHAFIFRGTDKSLMFLPDHDTWKETLKMYDCSTIRDFLKKLKTDIALIDGTFWSMDELGGHGRDQRVVPHPPVSESLDLLGQRQEGDPEIFLTHLNHTNPLYDRTSKEFQQLTNQGWNVTTQGMTFKL
jgi:pyrroloquinoline quinone biosynthesis protein B